MNYFSNYSYDTIIVGGGITGLFLAYKLKDTGSSILLIESSDRLGGKINTIRKKGVQYECGAARFHESHTKFISLIHDLELENDIIQLPKDIDYILRGKKDFKKSYKTNNNLELDGLLKKAIDNKSKLDKGILENISFYQYLILLFDHETACFIKDSFGYDSELEKLNAYSALEMFQNDFFKDNNYYVLKRGLSSIIEQLQEILSKCGNVTIKMKCSVKDVKDDHVLSENDDEYYYQKLILTIPKEKIVKLNYFENNQLYNSVESVPLLRIYFKYPKNNVWFKNLKRTITDNYIRHIIPIDYDNGLIMISYTDGKYAKMLESVHLNGDNFLIKVIHKEIKQLLGITPPKPDFISVHYWHDGIHFWKNGINMNDFYHQIIKSSDKEIYVCGESYSKKQGWIEGCLETAYDVIKKLPLGKLRLVSDINDCDSEIEKEIVVDSKKLQRYTIQEVIEKKKWIVIDIDGNKNIYDVTKWMNQHPGGSIIKKGIDANNHYIDGQGESPIQLFKKYHSNWVIDKHLMNNPIIPLKGVLI